MQTFVSEHGGSDVAPGSQPADLTGTVDERMRQLEQLSDDEQSTAWLRRQLDGALAAWAADATRLEIDREARSDF